MTLMRQQLAICRLESSSPIPEWAGRSSAFTAITRTATELSIVAADDVATACHALRASGHTVGHEP